MNNKNRINGLASDGILYRLIALAKGRVHGLTGLSTHKADNIVMLVYNQVLRLCSLNKSGAGYEIFKKCIF